MRRPRGGLPLRNVSRALCAAVLLLAAGGCVSKVMSPAEVMTLRDYDADAFIARHAAGQPKALDVEAAVALALAKNPLLTGLRHAAETARAETGSALELRDPELSLGYGEGERTTDRSWLVPKAELAPLYSYPNKDYLISEDPAQLAREKDPLVQRALIPPGGQYDYLAYSSNRYSGTTMDSDSWRMGVRFFPPNPFLAQARGAALRAAYAAALADVYAEEWRVICRIREIYAELAHLQRQQALLQDLIEIRQASAKNTSTLSEQKHVPLVDAITATHRLFQAIAERDKLDNENAILLGELVELTGQAIPASAIVLSPPTVSTLQDLEPIELQRTALARRKDIAALYWRTQQAEAALSEARRLRIPWFNRLEGSYSESTRRDDPDANWALAGRTAELDPLYSLAVDEQAESEWRVEALVNIPLFSLGPQTTRIQRAQHQQALAALAATTRTALDQVLTATHALRQAQQRSAEFQSGFLPRLHDAESALALMDQNNSASPSDLEKLREIILEMKTLQIRFEYDLQAATLRLKAALGGDPDDPKP